MREAYRSGLYCFKTLWGMALAHKGGSAIFRVRRVGLHFRRMGQSDVDTSLTK